MHPKHIITTSVLIASTILPVLAIPTSSKLYLKRDSTFMKTICFPSSGPVSIGAGASLPDGPVAAADYETAVNLISTMQNTHSSDTITLNSGPGYCEMMNCMMSGIDPKGVPYSAGVWACNDNEWSMPGLTYAGLGAMAQNITGTCTSQLEWHINDPKEGPVLGQVFHSSNINVVLKAAPSCGKR